MRKIWSEELIEVQILEVMSIFNINRMPTSLEIRQSKLSGLDSAISKTGGLVYWAKRLNLSLKIPIIFRTEEDIKNEIFAVMQHLNINRMPSKSEIESVYTNGGLHNRISKGLGYYGWAEKLNLQVKESDTLMGITYEKICLDCLISKGYDVKNTTVKAPYDLMVNDNIKIDVKSGTAYDLNGCRTHTFGINKPLPVCDLYVIYALDETREDIERTFIIPSKDLKLHSLSIGTNSKYDKYIDRWDLIDQYDKFYKSVS